MGYFIEYAQGLVDIKRGATKGLKKLIEAKGFSITDVPAFGGGRLIRGNDGRFVGVFHG